MILFVDDMLTERHLFELQVRPNRVHAVGTAAEALLTVKGSPHQYSCIVCDVFLCDARDEECRDLLAELADQKSIPFAFHSATSRQHPKGSAVMFSKNNGAELSPQLLNWLKKCVPDFIAEVPCK